MTSRICATAGILSLWLVFFLTLHGSLPSLLRYIYELQSNYMADFAMRLAMRDHMSLPGVGSLMALAVLWAPVIDNTLENKHGG